MTYSIYHFFVDLCKKKQEFFSKKKLESFPFDEQMLSCVGDGKFPDLAIKLNNDKGQAPSLSPQCCRENLTQSHKPL